MCAACTLIVVITAAEGGEKFWGPIKDRYWVLYHGGVGGCLGNLMYLRVGFRYSYVLKAYARVIPMARGGELFDKIVELGKYSAQAGWGLL